MTGSWGDRPAATVTIRVRRLAVMSGRDRHEEHRVSTPLELFFDLTFVIAFSAAANEFAHSLATAHVWIGLASFTFCMFAIMWAWINFTWFASAYDTDDWLFRLTTMVQMVGVLILAMGIPAIFSSMQEGRRFDNEVVVIGYIVMRVAMVAQWIRAGRQDPPRRRTCFTYAAAISVAQVGWSSMLVLHPSVLAAFFISLPLYVMELSGPVIAESKAETPWHAHHVAERYGLMQIIALGECLIGTVASLSAVVHDQGWTVTSAVVGLAGTGLAFGMWWLCFLSSPAEILHVERKKAWLWGYGHVFLFSAIAATGAGLHAGAYLIGGDSKLSVEGVVAAVAVPVAVFGACLVAFHTHLRGIDRLHVVLLADVFAVLTAAVALAHFGASYVVCLVVIALAPVLPIVADEVTGESRREEAIA